MGGGGDEGDITRAELQVAPEVVLFNLELRRAWSAMPADCLVALAGFSNPFQRRGLPEVGLGCPRFRLAACSSSWLSGRCWFTVLVGGLLECQVDLLFDLELPSCGGEVGRTTFAKFQAMLKVVQGNFELLSVSGEVGRTTLADLQVTPEALFLYLDLQGAGGIVGRTTVADFQATLEILSCNLELLSAGCEVGRTTVAVLLAILKGSLINLELQEVGRFTTAGGFAGRAEGLAVQLGVAKLWWRAVPSHRCWFAGHFEGPLVQLEVAKCWRRRWPHHHYGPEGYSGGLVDPPQAFP